MKIGFSFGRCVRDIVNGTVDIKDVTVIVARTHMETMEHVQYVIDEYLFRPGYLRGLDKDRCHEVAKQLWDRGLIHQPRASGSYRGAAAEQYVWMDLFPSFTDADETVTEAWNHYRAMLNLLHGAAVPRRPEAV